MSWIRKDSLSFKSELILFSFVSTSMADPDSGQPYFLLILLGIPLLHPGVANGKR